MIWNKSELAEMLRSNKLVVSFIKKDGSGRIMTCTLQESYLPVLQNAEAREENPEVLAVWDIDNNGWRSFRLESINSVRIVND